MGCSCKDVFRLKSHLRALSFIVGSTKVINLFYMLQCILGMTYGYIVILRALCRCRLHSGYKVILGGGWVFSYNISSATSLN